MKPLPEVDDTIVLRTDFSDDDAWETLKKAFLVSDEFDNVFDVDFIDDVEYDGVTIDDILETEKVPDIDFEDTDDDYFTYIFIVDKLTIEHPEHPIICLDLFEEPYQRFRFIPSQFAGIEGNLSIANMDFEDFITHVDEDGIFRGF